jgi:hypothetical protein
MMKVFVGILCNCHFTLNFDIDILIQGEFYEKMFDYHLKLKEIKEFDTKYKLLLKN